MGCPCFRKKSSDGMVLSDLINTYRYVLAFMWLTWILCVSALIVSVNDSPKKTECEATHEGVIGEIALPQPFMIRVVDKPLSRMCRRWVGERVIREETCWKDVKTVDEGGVRCPCYYQYSHGQCIVLNDRPTSSSILILIAFVVTILGVMCIASTVRAVRGFKEIRKAAQTILLTEARDDDVETAAFSVGSDDDANTRATP